MERNRYKGVTRPALSSSMKTGPLVLDVEKWTPQVVTGQGLLLGPR